jgi:aryl-alcohol dehydrogenase-like predicted oxidoreductase
LSAFPPRVELGRTGLRSSPIGLGSSYGLGERGVRSAFERGIRFFYWGSLRREAFGRGMAELCARERDELVVVVQTYARVAALMAPSLERALRKLRTERTDFLLLGWWNGRVPARIRDAAARLVERGLARAILVSCHHRPNFARAAHPGAEGEVFPRLDGSGKAVVSYTATSWGHLCDPGRIPAGERVPSAADCYRFALSNSAVDVALAGPRDERELEAVFEAIERGPLQPDEDAWLRRVGRSVRASEGRSIPWLFSLGQRNASERQS